MAAVIVGGVIVIWLGLSGGRAVLQWLAIQLHGPAALIAPLVLALVETLLFLASVPSGDLFPEPQRLPATVALIALAWLINGVASGVVLRRHRLASP